MAVKKKRRSRFVVEVVGTVQRIDVSGIGPNSGEITLVILPDNTTEIVEVFGGILPPESGDPAGLENGVFASYVQMAGLAYITGRKIWCSYLTNFDKPRINGLSLKN
jgi:hypothetical protein